MFRAVQPVTMRESVDWGHRVPDQEWELYQLAMHSLRERGVPYAYGGGFAFGRYSHCFRDTKDLDLYILPEHRETAVRAINDAGFEDIHSRSPYDPQWIYRGMRQGVLVDLIWQLANYRARVDEVWLQQGPMDHIRGWPLRAIPAEELIFAKIYIVQQERCDWPDLMAVIYRQGMRMDWDRIIHRLGPDDVGLLRGVMSVFTWMCPGRAMELPGSVWDKLQMPPPCPARMSSSPIEPARVRLLDSRSWFGPLEELRVNGQPVASEGR